MKKYILLLIIGLVIIPFVFAQNSFRMPDRSFEIGLFNTSIHFANDFMPIFDIFQESIVLDLDDLARGFRLNFGFSLLPIYVNINAKTWGFGLSTGLESLGSVELSGRMLSLNLNSTSATSQANMALFATAGINSYFYIQDFKVNISPSVFLTLAYARSKLVYTLDRSDDFIEMYIRLNADVYTAYRNSVFKDSMLSNSDFSGVLSPNASPGVDFSFGIEYPLSQVIGLNERARYLDFDVGINFVNIPVLPSVLTSYTSVWAEFDVKLPLNDFDFDDFSDIIAHDNVDDDESDNGYIEVERPFKLILWANWRPFGNQLLTLRPVLGFAVSRHFYSNPFSLEAGINARLDLFNTLIVNAGINYQDRMWVNNVRLAVNLWLLELHVGVDVRSQDLFKSFSTAGLGVNFGIKLGF